MTLAPLLATEVTTRLAAVETLGRDVPGAAFAIRDVLLGDEDADVRAAAAAWIGDLRAAVVTTALLDALYDTHPSVRMAACRSLARLGAREATATLERLALEEPIWWVRRAAVLALARVAREAAIAVLRAALDDPFWRVRHAAARALVAIGSTDASLHERITATTFDGSERAEGAVRFIQRKLARTIDDDARDPRPTSATAATATSDVTLEASKLADPDPAVVAARLEQGRKATDAELVLYLGDPHEALRDAAAKRLRASGNTRALLAATLWLDEPRIPHAPAAVIGLLDSLGPEVEDLLDAALRTPDARPGAAVWALSYVEGGARWDRLDEVLAALRASTAMVRRAAVAVVGAALAERGSSPTLRDEALARLREALDDGDEDVRRLAVHALVRSGDHDARAAVCALQFESLPRLVRRLVVIAAHEIGALPTLCLAARDADPETRARALSALQHRELLGSEERGAAETSEDPWLRGAVLDAASALRVLRDDLDPSLKRAAFLEARQVLEAARIAACDGDPWLRVRAAERLARSTTDSDLVEVLRLSRDPELAVRAAAADVLEHASSSLAARLERVRETASLPIKEAADTWLGTRAPALLEAAAGLERPMSVERVLRRPQELVIASPRALGRTGLVISPLVLSGAHEPSVASLFRAMHAGCNAFFWEPRYRMLSTFLRAAAARGQLPLVVAGTYHATERAVRADVERALRALDRDHLDVFLVYWTRSHARLQGELPRALERLRREGLVRAIGFSTHDRALAEEVIGRPPWDAVMVRHSAAHPGAEERLFAKAEANGVGVLGFSATSYGRLLGRSLSAGDCYRYSLAQRGVTAVLSAPRGGRELVENLDVLDRPTLDLTRLAELRALGAQVRRESLDFARHIRRFPAAPSPRDVDLDLDALLETALARDDERW